jgi:hypothetical protein
MNAVGRFLLLNLIILPTRPKKSAHAYQAIWDATRGSPLLYHGQDLAAAVATRLGADWQVELGMRYGNPSIASALDKLIAAGVDRVVALPLFPHTASSSSGSALAELYASPARARRCPGWRRCRRSTTTTASSPPRPRWRRRSSPRTGPSTCCSRSTACPSATCAPPTRRAPLPGQRRAAAPPRRPQPRLLPRAELRDRPRADRAPRARPGHHLDRVPVAARQACRGSVRTPIEVLAELARQRRQARRGDVPGVRRRLPRDRRGDRPARGGVVEGARRRVADAGAVAQRHAGVGRCGGGDGPPRRRARPCTARSRQGWVAPSKPSSG